MDTGNTSQLTHRFKFSKSFQDELSIFSIAHRYDNPEDFKESWNTWKDRNQEMIALESRSLTERGYEKDIDKKMYTSVRYYFKNKSQERPQPRARRNYISIQGDIISSMDAFIGENRMLKPSESFKTYMNENFPGDIVGSDVFTSPTPADFDKNDKLKKTYKNRYYLLVTKTKINNNY